MTTEKNGRRRMWKQDQNEAHARRSQAASDALKRKQKLKKSRVVKRHIFYKQKKHLLSQLEASEKGNPLPIVAEGLGVPGEEDDFSAKLKGTASKTESTILADENTNLGLEHEDVLLKSVKSDHLNGEEQSLTCKEPKLSSKEIYKAGRCEIIKSQSASNFVNEVTEADEAANVNTGLEPSNNEITTKSFEEKSVFDTNHERSSKTRNYLPFAKQRREYEEWKKQQEEQRRQKEEDIIRREKMLSESQKRRKQQVRLSNSSLQKFEQNIQPIGNQRLNRFTHIEVYLTCLITCQSLRQSKQHRKVTKRGQPKLGHRVDSLLARMERQIQEKQ